MRPAAAMLLVLAALASHGCSGGEPPAADSVRAYIEQAVPGAEFRRDSHIRLGRFTLGLVKGVMRLVAAGGREDRQMMANIRSVDIASYEVLALPAVAELSLPPRMERRMAEDGWYPMVKEREEDSHTWIFVREAEVGTVSNLYIVELDSFELTIIDLAGRLDRIAAEMVADDPDAFLASLDG
jgi:hypothetical protein